MSVLGAVRVEAALRETNQSASIHLPRVPPLALWTFRLCPSCPSYVIRGLHLISNSWRMARSCSQRFDLATVIPLLRGDPIPSFPFSQF